MIASATKRPRNVGVPEAAAILYGDWGTSKAYVIGLAFAVAGYASFWLIAPMCLLTALVGFNYIRICKHYPEGGGVYASVRKRSEIISMVGAFLLIADYLVTAAISALSAFQYLGVAHPEKFAAVAILAIGALNYFGPKHTGGLAFLVAVPTALVVVLLTCFSIPHLKEAVAHLEPMQGGFLANWNGFVTVVLALSGVEAIANATGVMKLDPGCDPSRPSVSKTSTRAIAIVMIEVCVLTAVLGLAMHALPGLVAQHGEVNAPGAEGVRDYMLRYMAQVFVGSAWGPAAGKIAAWIVSLVIGILLLSAVNTAIVALIAMQYLMSRDGEIPVRFQKLNAFGVPSLAMVAAAAVPALLVLLVRDVSGLADLYAVGVVGAIAANLGASATDRTLGLARWERWLMFCTFLVMLAIEVSLFVDKPNARAFVVTLLAAGLILRGLVFEQAQRKKDREAKEEPAAVRPLIPSFDPDGDYSGPPMLCAIRGIGPTMRFALEEAKARRSPLYLLYVREQPVLAEGDRKRRWQEDPEAREIFEHAMSELGTETPLLPCYSVSDSPADTIADVAATVGASRVILGAPRRANLATFLRGNVIRRVASVLPDNIDLLVYA